ncbi:hypothetical protein T492DRAFT_868854 [Pavlovales sp. CCMP2436]|nr:hypothetical protein T492DRAFT_868854 [Pavlovales sp. CCMP2436]
MCAVPSLLSFALRLSLAAAAEAAAINAEIAAGASPVPPQLALGYCVAAVRALGSSGPFISGAAAAAELRTQLVAWWVGGLDGARASLRAAIALANAAGGEVRW